MRCDPVMMAELGGPLPREGIAAKVARDAQQAAADLRPRHGRGAVDGQDFGGEAEDLSRALSVLRTSPFSWSAGFQ